MKKKITKIIHNKKGSTTLGMIISTFVILCVIVTCISVLSFFVQYNNLSTIARRLTRSIELSGIVDAQTYTLLDALSDTTTLTPELAVHAPVYFDAEMQKIQVRESFTVTLEDDYTFTLIEPAFGSKKIEVIIPIKVKMSGMSEKFWK